MVCETLVKYWHRLESTAVFALNLGQQLLNAVYVLAGFEILRMWLRLVTSTFCRMLHFVQTGPQRFVYNRFGRCAQFSCYGSRAFQNIIIYVECRSDSVIIASFKMMSAHQLPFSFCAYASPSFKTRIAGYSA